MLEKHEHLGNGIFSSNQISSATGEIVYAGINLDKFAIAHPMTEEAKEKIFLDEIDPKFHAFWEDRKKHPDDYAGWLHDKDHTRKVSYSGECEIEVYRKPPALYKITGEITLYDPKNILAGVTPIKIKNEVALKIYHATRPEYVADFGHDIQQKGIEQCIKCMALGIDVLADHGLRLANGFGVALRSGTYNRTDLNGTQLGSRQANYGTMESKSKFATHTAKEEESIEYSFTPPKIDSVRKNIEEEKKYNQQLKRMSHEELEEQMKLGKNDMKFFAARDEMRRRDRSSIAEKEGKDKTIKLDQSDEEAKPNRRGGGKCC